MKKMIVAVGLGLIALDRKRVLVGKLFTISRN